MGCIEGACDELTGWWTGSVQPLFEEGAAEISNGLNSMYKRFSALTTNDKALLITALTIGILVGVAAAISEPLILIAVPVVLVISFGAGVGLSRSFPDFVENLYATWDSSPSWMKATAILVITLGIVASLFYPPCALLPAALLLLGVGATLGRPPSLVDRVQTYAQEAVHEATEAGKGLVAEIDPDLVPIVKEMGQGANKLINDAASYFKGYSTTTS